MKVIIKNAVAFNPQGNYNDRVTAAAVEGSAYFYG
jgi:hypothetical protein